MDGTSNRVIPSTNVVGPAEPASPHDPPQPVPQYTTVGSIYNPEGTQPLQAPTRRGRAFKWPNNNTSGDQAYVARSFLGNNVARSYGASPEHLTAAGHLPHYSPLQQNSDRAVSPIVTRSRTNVEHPLSPDSTWDCSSPDPSLVSRTDLEPDTGDPGNNMSEQLNSDCAELRQMSVKTLSNLASYPNPMQKHAQNKLRARPSPAPVIANGTNPQLTPARLSEMPVVPIDNIRTILRSETFDNTFNTMGNSNGADTEEHNLPDYSNLTESVHGKLPPNVLGAPQPLAAGPPGTRLYQEWAKRSSTNPSKSSRPQINPALEPISHQDLQVRDGFTRSSRGTDDRETEASSLGPMGGLETPYPKIGKIVDTISEDEALCWYPRGLSPDFNAFSEPTTEYAAYQHLLRGLSLKNLPREIQEERSRKLQSDFSSGTHLYHKAVYETTDNNETTRSQRHIGPYCDPNKPSCMIDHRPMTVEKANKMSTQEHAKPLFWMLNQTLATYPFDLSGQRCSK